MRRNLDWPGRPLRSFGAVFVAGIIFLFALLENLLEAPAGNEGAVRESEGASARTSGRVDKEEP